MMQVTCRAKSVRFAAQEFREKIMGDDFFALHWRYDDGSDFGRHCAKGLGGLTVCALLSITDLGKFGERLSFYMNSVVDKYEEAVSSPKNITLPRVKNRALYIASPPNQIIKLNPMIESLANSGIKVFSGKDLTEWADERYTGVCPELTLRDEMHDFRSQVEMEICSISGLFFSSDGSSWSENISMERQAKRMHWWDRSNTQFMAKDHLPVRH